MCFKPFLYDFGGYNKIISQYIHSSIESKSLMLVFKYIGFYIANFHFFPIHFLLLLATLFIIVRNTKRNSLQVGTLYAKYTIVLLLSLTIGALLFESLKQFFHYPRPYCSPTFHVNNDIIQMFRLRPEACNYSFPSGHMAYASIIILSLWKILNKHMKLLGILFIITVGVSRVAMARHFLADIVYSFLIVFLIINPISHAIIEKYFSKLQPLVKKVLKKVL